MREDGLKGPIIGLIGGIVIVLASLGAFLLLSSDASIKVRVARELPTVAPTDGGAAISGTQSPSRVRQPTPVIDLGTIPPMPPDPNAPQRCAQSDGCLASNTEFYQAYDDPKACDGVGKRVCVVPIGDVPKDLVDHLVRYYAEEYNLELRILPPIALAGGRHPERPGQRETWRLRAAFPRFYPEYDADREVTLIGLTALDVFYPDRPEWQWVFGSTFSFDGTRPHQAIISIFRMDQENWGQPKDDELRNLRTRKLMNKYIALIHYGLDESTDPKSVLFGGIASVGDLDNLDERIPLQRQ